MPAQRIGFPKRLEIEDERQVHCQLDARSRADRTDMLDAPAKVLQDRAGSLDIFRFAAGKPDELALTRRSDGAADGAFYQGAAGTPHPLGNHDLGFRPDRAHLDEKLPGYVAGEETRIA